MEIDAFLILGQVWLRVLINHVFVIILSLPAYNPSSPRNGFPLHSE